MWQKNMASEKGREIWPNTFREWGGLILGGKGWHRDTRGSSSSSILGERGVGELKKKNVSCLSCEMAQHFMYDAVTQTH